jgi:hypothetical protein
MKTDIILRKAKQDILKLKTEHHQTNTHLIELIINVVKNRCGILLANQLVEELALEKKYLTNVELLN